MREVAGFTGVFATLGLAAARTGAYTGSMRKIVPLLVLPLLAGPAAASDPIDVKAHGPKVDVKVTAAPLNDVLDRLSKQTGMKLVYEGQAPRMVISANLVGLSPMRAVISVMEGLGVNYALMTDPTGSRIETLMIVGAGGPAAPSGGVAPQPSVPLPSHAPEPMAIDEEPLMEEGDPGVQPEDQRPSGPVPVEEAAPPPPPNPVGPSGAPAGFPAPPNPFAPKPVGDAPPGSGPISDSQGMPPGVIGPLPGPGAGLTTPPAWVQPPPSDEKKE